MKILLIYTGGTIGMVQDPETSALKPFDFSHIMDTMPELKRFGYTIDVWSFTPVIDSSDVKVEFWIELAHIIGRTYNDYDGYVILHGTDTMAYSASALSFILDNLEKPVVFTGSQLPIGALRTDGKENIISAIEIAASLDEYGHAKVPQVCIFFENQLLQGNRATKYNAENFSAFYSGNYPVLAEVGIHIKFNDNAIHHPKKWGKELIINDKIDNNVAILKLFPGISKEYVDAVLGTKNLRALILETYGSGNAPLSDWFLKALKMAIDEGLIVLNVTQCNTGSVNMNAYANGMALKEIGVISGYDITTESAITKLFFLLGKFQCNETVKMELDINISGEFSKNI